MILRTRFLFALPSALPFALPWIIAGLVAGCNPKIGDSCSSSTDCSTNGDRLCDTTQPGGYCTVFNCEPDTCPEESQCIAFDTWLDPRCQDMRWGRFERTFCMKRCKNDGDCRSGYVCADMGNTSNAWGAKVADTNPSGTKVCVPPWTEGAQPDGPTDVCGPFDSGVFDASTPQQDAETGTSEDVIDADSLAPEDGSAEDAANDVNDGDAVDDVEEETAVDAADEPDEDATQDVVEDTADIDTTP